MNEGEVEKTLSKIEKEIDKGNFTAAKELGFWKVVRAVKKNPELAVKFAEKIGRVDQRLFESKAWVKLDYGVGTMIELIGALFGLFLLYLGASLEGTASTVFYVASTLVLMTALHPISHSIAGKLYGIGFHFYFLNGPMLIEPTLKVDYSTYVKAPAKNRAVFHLAGAINSVLITFFVLLVALLDANTQPSTQIILAMLWLFTTASEIFPLIFIRLGMPKILFADFRKSDSHRALREWNLTK
jgi:uncharacterized Tic20 family protein